MKKTAFLLLLGLLLLGSPQGVLAQTTAQRQKDSLRQALNIAEGKEKIDTYNRLANLYTREVRNEGVIDSLFAIYDALDAEAIKQGDFNTRAAVRTNKLVDFSNKRLFEEVIRQAPAFLAFMEEKQTWKFYYQSYEILISAYRRLDDYERALREAQALYDHAEKRQDKGGMGVASYAMSLIYSEQNRYDEKERTLRESIALLDGNGSYLNSLADASANLIGVLITQKRYDEALQQAVYTEEVNRRYEIAAKSPMPYAWINVWVYYRDIYVQTKAFDKAQKYIDKIDSLSNGSVRQLGAQAMVLGAKGEFKKALELIDKEIEISPNKIRPKSIKHFLLMDMGEIELAKTAFNEVVADLDSAYTSYYTTRLDEIRTEHEVEKHIAQKERNRQSFLFALGGCALLLILLSVSVRYNRIINRKNRSLYRQIKEQDRLAKEITLPPEPLPGNKAQRELVARLKDYLLCDDNLAQIELRREELAAAVGSNRSSLSDAVRIITGKTLIDYIRILQLEETRRLFDSHSELTVEAVAIDCGFQSTSTFYRLFRKHYGISPSEYRKMAQTPEI